MATESKIIYKNGVPYKITLEVSKIQPMDEASIFADLTPADMDGIDYKGYKLLLQNRLSPIAFCGDNTYLCIDYKGKGYYLHSVDNVVFPAKDVSDAQIKAILYKFKIATLDAMKVCDLIYKDKKKFSKDQLIKIAMFNLTEKEFISPKINNYFSDKKIGDVLSDGFGNSIFYCFDDDTFYEFIHDSADQVKKINYQYIFTDKFNQY